MTGLEEIYSWISWIEDPDDPRARERKEEILNEFERVIWPKISEFFGNNVRILDICSGTGIAGVSIANFISRRGKRVEVTLVDLREDALKKAFKWKEGEVEIRTEVKDVTKDSLGRGYDLALLYGSSMGHFSPKQALKLFSRISNALSDRGIFLLEEMDRFSFICLLRNYRDVLAEKNEEETILSIHVAYDPLEGIVTRALVSLEKMKALGKLKVHFWSLSDLIGLLLCFFKEVEAVKRKRGRWHWYLICKGPRRRLLPEDFEEI